MTSSPAGRESHSPFPVPLNPALQWCAVIVGILLRLRQYLHARPLWLDEAMLANNILARPFTSLLQPLGRDRKSTRLTSSHG